MKYIPVLLLLVLLLPIAHLLVPGLPVTHDGQDHVVRIANFYQSLSEGNIVPRWAGNLNWGFGHPVVMFLYPLPSYAASLFHIFGLSILNSTKLVFAVSYLLSGFSMFYWAKGRWGTTAGLIAGLLYTFAPYRFVDLTVRGAIGEHVAFVFIPLILFALDGLIKNSNKQGWISVLALSVAGLLLSHNAVSLMMIPIGFIYSIYLVLFETKKRLGSSLYIGIGTVLGVLISSFFLMPAFWEGKYTLRDIVTQGEVITRMVNPLSFIYSPWNYGGGTQFSKEVGIIQWMFVIIGTYMVFTTKKMTKKIFGFGMLGVFAGSLFLMTEWSIPIWNSVTILQKFQFPWRLLTITVFVTSAFGAYACSFISEKRQQLVLVVTVFVLIFTTYHMWIPKEYRLYDDAFFTNIYHGTTDTGESSPIWSVRFMETEATAPLQIIEGNAIFNMNFRNSTKRIYNIQASERTRFVENTLYFPGWIIIDNGTQIPIEFQDPNWRGRMTFWLEPGEHDVEIIFTETKLRSIANSMSLIGMFGLVLLVSVPFVKKMIGKK